MLSVFSHGIAFGAGGLFAMAVLWALGRLGL